VTADPATLTQLFFGAIDRWHDRPVVMRAKRNARWEPISYAELLARVQATSLGLLSLGVKEGDRVGILSENRPEWAIADFACLAARCADVPVYPTLPAGQITHVLRDSGAVALFVSTREQLAKIQEIRHELPALRHVIAFNADAAGSGVHWLEDVESRVSAGSAEIAQWRARALAATPGDVATLIYTSGTTGDPKGVMLTHGNIASNVTGGLKRLPLRDDDECLSFLPLSHIFERMAGHYTVYHAGTIINYATSIDTVAAEMLEVKPSVVLSVPRLFEKIYSKVVESVAAGSPVKRAIFMWARRTGEAWVDLSLAGTPIPARLAFTHRIADKLVFSKLRARVGGRLRFFVSGGAPLNPVIAKFFFAAGMPVLEGYGLTETSPVIAVNGPGETRLGTVGRPIEHAEVQIAQDGEILTRGPHVMKGYFQNPQATAEVIDADGWLHTGDIGELDKDGFLRITDRKKDLIVTAGGKNIAPQPIENLARTSKFVASAVMIGDKRRFPAMLIVPNEANLKAWAGHKQIGESDYAALLRRPEVYAKLERELAKVFHDLAHYEVPKKYILLEKDFSIGSGQLTPKMSVRRKAVEAAYRDAIEALYSEGAAG
jgi:long-chain acyl-CoA synthetase